MSIMTVCAASWHGAHRFEPRYDTKLSTGLESVRATSPAYLEALKDKTYVRDVCVRCGETVERQ